MYKASVIVTISNEYALTENFFDNLFSIIDKDIDVFAVVDGDTDRQTFKYLQSLQNIHSNLSITYLSENVGYSKANNIGGFLSKAPYLIFLNSDTFPIGDSLYKMLSFMDHFPEIGVTQGLILYPQTNLVQSAGHVFSFYKTAHAFDGLEQQVPIVQKTAERQALGSGFYVTRRNLFVKENGFNELFYNAWEGLEYSLKLHAQGYKCMYYPEAKAYHVKGSGRNRRFRDESYQTGYFWHQWGDKVQIDLPDIYSMQLHPNDYKYQYLFVNGSSTRDNIWDILLNKLPFNLIGRYNIEKSMVKTSISLEDSVPASFLQSKSNLLFTVDSFKDIINNYHIFNYRASFNAHDIILDLHGNVIYPIQYQRK